MKHLLSIIFILVFSFAAFGSNDAECTFAFTPSQMAFDGRFVPSQTISVSTQPGCQWQATSNADWISVAGQGTGSGTITVNASLNPAPLREGTLTIAGQTYSVKQYNGCTFELPAGQSIPASGVGLSYGTKSHPQCRFIFYGPSSPGSDWLGPMGSIVNNGPARSGSFYMRGYSQNLGSEATQTLESRVSQASGCAFLPSKTSENFSAAAANGSFTVQTVAGCQWQTVSQNDWITVNVGQSWSGNGTVGYSVAANTGEARTGTINAGGQIFTVSQAAALQQNCTYSLSQSETSIPATGGSGTFGVVSASGCLWNATTSNTWITISSNADGSGNQNITFSVASNKGAARTGMINVGGQIFIVNQSKSRTRVRITAF